MQADVEDVFVVVGGTSQRPAITPGSPEAAGAEREERVAVLVAGYCVAEVSVAAAECEGGGFFGDVAAVAADWDWRLRESCVGHGGSEGIGVDGW